MRKRRAGYGILLLGASFTFASARSIARYTDHSEEPPHLTQAKQLVENLRGATENKYGGGKAHIEWEADHCSARTVCSSFTTLLIEHTYGWTGKDIRVWLDSTHPEADAYHDAIIARHRFKRIVHVTALRPGDILAVKYADHHVSKNGVEDTGHVMIVAAAPQSMNDRKPVVAGTRQYLVTVIDSSASGHGPNDTRHQPNGRFTGGIGRGEMRLYADTSGRIAGYTWSSTTNSAYYTTPDRDMVAGRLEITEPER